ncbi:hypothetical protein BDP27DRAFT_409236 [Rhodocollybia butyracea]|uniref:Uncharacterized protein n=1 Tax=Rhodocollybia butyracea TaxID=206335 RepID=A0A9P5TYI9_9AGAR|nr:hypothetical protein BDP27DRAFT_409236 [Rhodocollybia butyracea]
MYASKGAGLCLAPCAYLLYYHRSPARLLGQLFHQKTSKLVRIVFLTRSSLALLAFSRSHPTTLLKNPDKMLRGHRSRSVLTGTRKLRTVRGKSSGDSGPCVDFSSTTRTCLSPTLHISTSTLPRLPSDNGALALFYPWLLWNHHLPDGRWCHRRYCRVYLTKPAPSITPPSPTVS